MIPDLDFIVVWSGDSGAEVIFDRPDTKRIGQTPLMIIDVFEFQVQNQGGQTQIPNVWLCPVVLTRHLTGQFGSEPSEFSQSSRFCSLSHRLGAYSRRSHFCMMTECQMKTKKLHPFPFAFY